MSKEKFGWGILGPGRIGKDFAESIELLDDAYVAASGSRSLARSKEFCDRFGGTPYGSYEEMVKDPDVDIVYVATPHPMHEEHVILAAEAGKDILCEKPFAVNKKQAENMFAAAKANNVFLMEGLWSRFFPAWRYVKELITSGELGAVTGVYASTGWGCPPGWLKDDNRLLDPNLAGGALLDGGVYSLASMTVATGKIEKPKKVEGTIRFSHTGVDAETNMMIQFEDGLTAMLLCGLYRREFFTNIALERGNIIIPRHRNPTTVQIERISNPESEIIPFRRATDKIEKSFPYEREGFQFEAAVVQDCIRKGLKICPEVPPEETLMLAEICDKIRADNGFVYPFEK